MSTRANTANTSTATFLSKDEFATYKGGQNGALRLTAALWAFLVLLLVAFAAAFETGQSLVWVPAAAVTFVLVGWVQASLSNGFHEAVHYNFGEKHSDLASLVLLGYPTFFTLNYRTVHLLHHRHFGDPERDPDYAAFTPFPRSRGEFLKRLLFMGSGIAAARQLLTRNLKPQKKLSRSGKSAGSRAPEFLGLILVQLAILGLYSWILSPVWYVFLWVLPLGTIGKLAKSTRAFCEHGSPDREWVLRTIIGTPLQTGTLGMYGFHYHGEHHLYPWVPYPRLAALYERHQRELADPTHHHAEYEDEGAGKYEVFEGGYFRLLWNWYRDLPWRLPRRSTAHAV